MWQILFYSLIAILGSVGVFFIFAPGKVKSRVETFKNIHIRLIGIVIIIIGVAIIIQQITIGSLINIINSLKSK